MPEFGCRPGIKKAVNLWNTALNKRKQYLLWYLIYLCKVLYIFAYLFDLYF